MHHLPRPRFLLCGAMLLATLTACGGAGDASLGGTLSGLPSDASVTLQNNGANSLALSANGSFWFSGTVEAGSSYSVTVLT